MSATKPTIAEIEYLATLNVVRVDGYDPTSPELARMLLTALDKLQAAERRVAELEASTRWIPVSESLPPSNVHVNIVVDWEDGDDPASWAGFMADGKWRLPSSSFADGDEGGIAGVVTHWQYPLPPPTPSPAQA